MKNMQLLYLRVTHVTWILIKGFLTTFDWTYVSQKGGNFHFIDIAYSTIQNRYEKHFMMSQKALIPGW